MLLMNVGFWDRDRISEYGMLEMVAEGTPLMSVPRDTREEALLTCEANQKQKQSLTFLVFKCNKGGDGKCLNSKRIVLCTGGNRCKYTWSCFQ